MLIAKKLRALGTGRLYSLEHDAEFAADVVSRLERAGLAAEVDVIVAPLVRQRFGSELVWWYDLDRIAERLPSRIDLVVVDGPPAVDRWARWPAVEVFHDRLSPGAVVLLDDGRRRHERRIAHRWQADHDDLALYWHDTVKGTWKIEKLAESRHDGRVTAALRSILRTINPRPTTFGRWPVRR